MKKPLLHTIASRLKITSHLLKIQALWTTMINYFLCILCSTQYSCTHYTNYTKFEGFGFCDVMGGKKWLPYSVLIRSRENTSKGLLI